MKNKLYKRIAAAIVAVAMVSGAVTGGIGSTLVANADYTSPLDISPLTSITSGESHSIMLNPGYRTADGNPSLSVVTADKTSAKAGDTVTLTVNVADGEIPLEGEFNELQFSGGLCVAAMSEAGYQFPSLTKSGNQYTFVMPDSDVMIAAYFDCADYTVGFDDLDYYIEHGEFDYGRYVVDSSNSNNELKKADSFSPAHVGDTIRVGYHSLGQSEKYIVKSFCYSYIDKNGAKNNVDIQVNNDGNTFFSGEFTMPAYDVSIAVEYQGSHSVGIDSNAGKALERDKWTAVEGETVTLTGYEGYEISSVTVKCGETTVPVTSHDGGKYTFTMPDGDVMISADAVHKYFYVERSWDASSNEIVSSEKDFNLSSVQYLMPDSTGLGSGVWYYVNSDITISERITINGTANIILADGATLNCPKGIAVNAGNTLNIYGQTNDTGKIVAGSERYNAAIGSDDQDEDSGENGGGTINFYGGTIEATAGSFSAGIGGGNEAGNGNINIYGGTINAQGVHQGAGIGTGTRPDTTPGTIAIYGGKVTAQGGTDGAGIGSGFDQDIESGSIIINGGDIDAQGGVSGAGIGSGRLSDCGYTITINSGKVKAYSKDSDSKGTQGAAGIGSGKDSDLTGKIVINGGEINSYGSGSLESSPYAPKCRYGGAGIGTGFEGNIENSAEIIINGGTVTACGTYGGADIGAGAEEYFFGGGGECEGTIKLLGGTITLPAVDTDAAFVGHGCDGSEDGTLSLGTDMMVHFENKTPYSKMFRSGPCRTSSSETLIIEKCSHADITYTSTDTHHTANCRYCFTNFPTKSHSPDSNNHCTVCGYQGELCIISFDANGGSGTMENVSVVPNADYTLPECGFTAPEGYRFRCWSVNGEKIDAGDVITVSENTIITATYSKLTHHDAVAADYKNEGNIEYYTDEQGNNYILDGTDYVPVDSVTIPKLQIYMQVGLKSENSGSLDLNLLVPLPDAADPSDGYTFRFGNAETSFADCDTVTIDGRTCYLIRMTSAAKEMADEFEYAVLQNGTELMTDTTSVRAYVDAVLKGDYSDNVKNTCRAMLSYGAAAQAYFDYNTSNPANDGLEGTGADYEDVTISGSTFDKAALNEALTDAPVTYSQMTLSLDADTTLSLYFKVSDGADQTDAQAYIEENFTLDGEAVTAEANGTQYVVIRKTGITISDLLNEYALSFSGKDYMVSAGQYLCAASQRGSDNLKSLAKALYNYYLYATNQAEGA